MRTYLIAVTIVSLTLLGCAPEALDGFEADGGNNNANNANNSNNANNTNNVNNLNNATPGPQFTAVVDEFTVKCASIACHGAAATNVLTVAANNNANPQEVCLALTSDAATADGEALIVPNDPDTSNCITRMELMPTGDLKEMPQGTGSMADEIAIWEAWINGGASFTN